MTAATRRICPLDLDSIPIGIMKNTYATGTLVKTHQKVSHPRMKCQVSVLELHHTFSQTPRMASEGANVSHSGLTPTECT